MARLLLDSARTADGSAEEVCGCSQQRQLPVDRRQRR